MQLTAATGARAPGCTRPQQRSCSRSVGAGGPAADRDAADACRSGIMHRGSRNDGTDATHRASNRRKSTRLRSRSQQRSCSSVGSVGAGGPAGTDRDAADACRSGVMHRGSRTCRYRCNSPWQQLLQQHGRALHYPLAGRDRCSGMDATSAPPQASARAPGCTAGRNQCSSVGSVGAGGPAGTDRDAADACRSGIMHRGSRTCRYRCNSPCQQPAQEHTAAQPARNNAAAAQWAVWAPAAQQGPTVMLPTPAAAASCTAAVAHAGTDATHRGSNCCNSTAAHCTIPWPAGTAAAAWMQLLRRRRPAQEHPAAAGRNQCSSVGSVGAGGPAGTDRDAADACRIGITHRGSRTWRYRCNSPWQQPAQEHTAAQPAATTQLQLSGQCGRLGPSRTDRDAADACRSGIMHCGSRNDGTDATLRASNRRKSTRLRSRSQQRSCSSVGSVGAGGPAGTDRDAADACRSGVMHRGSRTCRYRCNSPWQQLLQQHGRALHYPLAGRDRCSGMDATSAPPQASARAPGCTAGRNQCSSVGSVGAGGPAGTDRDAADACRSGIMHRGSRTCRYRCNSPWQQPAQEHPAAQPAATTQLQLSGQCGRLGPSRTDRDAADACRSGIMHRGSRRYRCNSPWQQPAQEHRLRSRCNNAAAAQWAVWAPGAQQDRP